MMWKKARPRADKWLPTALLAADFVVYFGADVVRWTGASATLYARILAYAEDWLLKKTFPLESTYKVDASPTAKFQARERVYISLSGET